MTLSNIFHCLIPLLFVGFASCKPKPNPINTVDLSKGVFIINEGNFMSNNGEISFYNTDTGELTNNLFAAQNNNAVIGDVVQSMCISDSIALISVNNSKKIEIVDVKDFKHITTLSGFSYPRYIINVRENIFYLTNGKNPGEVKVIDTEKKEVVKTITVGNQRENLLLFSNKVFVADGAWGHDSTISIINATNDELIETIAVGDGATDLAADKNGNIWILCQGKSAYDYPEETESQLVCINTERLEIIERVTIGVVGDNYHPKRIASDIKTGYIYYVEHDGVYKMHTDSPHTNYRFIIGTFYGLELNSESGDVYVFNDNGFTSSGTMTVYNSEGQTIIPALRTGIGPNGAIFK
jgi:DNA-binding beta-propeller fold protein YncE